MRDKPITLKKISAFLLTMSFFITLSVIPVSSEDAIIWDTLITITGTTGEMANITLGEALDAHDDIPADAYDMPLPPQSPKKPYILAWFTSNMLPPYQTLWKDYKQNRTHADTFKSWNLSVQWIAENPAASTDLTLTWNTEDFSPADYTIILLCQEPGRIPLQNMFLNGMYTFTADANIRYDFSIICQYRTENEPPVVSLHYPPQASTGVDDWGYPAYRPPENLSITTQDPDGDLMNIQFQWCRHDYYHNNQWATLTTYGGVTDGTYAYLPSGNEWIWGNTTYTWSVNVTDGMSWANETYFYTTGGSRYDVNNDGHVNFVDAGRVWAHRTTKEIYEGIYDVNDDGVVNFVDAGITWTKRDNLAENAPPITENDTYSLQENTPLNITEQTAGVSANDVDFDNESFTVNLVKETDHGNITLNADGTFLYDPDQDFKGMDTFTYNASDGKNASNNATVMLNVGNPPVLSDIPDQTITQGGSFTSISLDDYVTDADNADDELLWTCSGNNTLIVTINTTTHVAVITPPSQSWTGSEIITFTVTDPIGLFDTDQATFKVNAKSSPGGESPPAGGGYVPPDNQQPVADASAGEPYHGFVGEPIQFDGSNSYDPDGDILIFLWDFGDGTTNTTSNPIHVYTALGTYTGSLKVSDGKGGEDTDTFTIGILAGNTPPTPPKVTGETHGDIHTMYTFTAVSTDADGDHLQYLFTWGDGTENITSLVESGVSGEARHSWSTSGIYTLTVQARDDYPEGGTLSEGTILTLYIDVFPLDPLMNGYLIDEDGDGLYDLFHNITANIDTAATRNQEGYYLIDDDGDTTVDYVVDVETNTITPYDDGAQGSASSKEPSYLPLIVGIFLILAAVVVFLWVIKKPEK